MTMDHRTTFAGPSPVWHPFTQHALAPEPPLVLRGEGAWLTTATGERILDAISSWWVITHGHCHPRIVAAIRDQAGELDQVIFAGHTHLAAEALARRLVALAPAGLAHVFFSDSGSTAVEVALKMAVGYWRNIAEPRSRILALEHGYHGDTIGTMSAGARGIYNAAYEPLLFDVTRLPFPAQGREEATLTALEAACREAPCAALLVEPLILGAGGMLVYPAWVLAEMRSICDRHGVLLIADEVMTGFGRTGRLFACEHASVMPDILCCAKGLTGGALPLAVTLCRREIFDAHYSEDRRRTFFHSSSFTANPIACAAANANLDIWDEEPVAERIAALGALQEERLARFHDDARFASMRRLGTVAALDLAVDDPGYLAGIGLELAAFFRERGLLLRPLGNTIYVMPPYCVTAGDLDRVYAAIAAAAEHFGRG
ncbi:adenosylmethionine-8-amino-7-oxononanoate aminotransferase [Chelatococcus caeni]|uniref:Adenosylmethionine-8-amino-7-oxononanoate aminotransferase n=1 Tax=Chelatococcus caeni TaxID=1348468 RepID=A0A840C003_9HYPH|nr:adenosylmethionine--8-amino-7-oxononanoate transaminase [Chelatococcus caeni]MBB4015837.1 adenosylmethionine-8-amino-7-oxononanoate aminotransferase [Chelatococcus caeni]